MTRSLLAALRELRAAHGPGLERLSLQAFLEVLCEAPAVAQDPPASPPQLGLFQEATETLSEPSLLDDAPRA
jgi:hypothetical protein